MANRDIFVKFTHFTKYSRIKYKINIFCYLHTHKKKGTTEHFGPWLGNISKVLPKVHIKIK